MSLTKFTGNTNIISQLADRPSISASELKTKFDEADTSVKDYLNNTLTTEVEQLVETEKTSLQGLINAIKTEILETITENEQAKYHVGRIIMDTENINPATYLGFGTWEYWGSGRVPVGVDFNDSDFNVSGQTGGEKTHILTINEMPAHKHGATNFIYNSAANPFYIDTSGTGKLSTATSQIEVDSSGGGQPHNNLQPYITCYMWKRVS